MTKDIMTRDETVAEIDRQTNESGRKMHRGARWKKRWSPSSHFVLKEIPIDKIEQPLRPHYMCIVARKLKKFDERPIFIDKNYPEQTTWRPAKTNGQKLSTLVIDGKHRHMAATLLKRKTLKAWVGVQAIQHFTDPDAKGYNWMQYSKNGQALLKRFGAA